MTRVRFDVITGEHWYPLTREVVRGALLELFKEAPDLREVIREVRFGCSRRTTREGRVVQRGKWFDIRVNFCLEDNKTRLIGLSKSWLRYVTICGGVPDPSNGQVVWSEPAAARYAAFILFHEAAHIVYMRRHGANTLGWKSDAREEERYCDEWAVTMLKRWTVSNAPRPGRRSGEI